MYTRMFSGFRRSALACCLLCLYTCFGHSSHAAGSSEYALFDRATSATSARLTLSASKGVVASAPEAAYGTNNGIAWKTPVIIGGQTVNLMMDTGSYYPWVLGPTLPKSSTAGHSIYDPTRSPTAKNTSLSFTQYYVGDFGAEGYQVNDTITIGNLTLTNAPIGVTTQLLGDVNYTGSDGIIGLMAARQETSLLDNIFQQVAAEIITFDLRNDSSGILDFGYVDHSLFQSGAQLTTVPVSETWAVGEVSFAMGGKVLGSSASSVPLDTGGEVIALPDDAATAYWAPLVANGKVSTTIPGPWNEGTLYIVPCGTQLPDLTVIFGGVASPYGNATISGEALAETSWPRGDGSCIGSVWSYPTSWIGAPFFYEYVVAMNLNALSVTYGAKAGK